MGETEKVVEKKNKTQKKSFFNGLKAEYKKIIWPDKADLKKQTIVVVITSVIMCTVIRLLDMLIQFGVGFIAG